jgi:hypothetical protein
MASDKHELRREIRSLMDGVTDLGLPAIDLIRMLYPIGLPPIVPTGPFSHVFKSL